MTKRIAILIAAVAVFLPLSAVASASAAAAPSPWWQVLTTSHPTHLWEAEDFVMEIETKTGEHPFVPGAPIAVVSIEVGGNTVGCLGTHNGEGFGDAICEGVTGFASTETAAELEALLESAMGSEAVEVTGGPVGGDNFKIMAPGTSPTLSLSLAFPPEEKEAENIFGSATLEVLAGGSGRLVSILTNLGNAPLDATTKPITITNELPEGVVASEALGYAGVQDKSGAEAGTPVDCTVEGQDLVTCTFEGTLPSYEAIEVEIFVSLTGTPPVAGAPGKVSVSGGNAPAASAPQEIIVSPEKVPFGIRHFSAQAEEEGGAPAVQAGGHPFQFTTTIQLNTGRLTANAKRLNPARIEQPALPRNFRFPLPAGFIGNATSVQKCPMEVFFKELPEDGCQPATAIGVASTTIIEPKNLGLTRIAVPIFNLPPAQGEPARFGFSVQGVHVVIGTSVDPDNEYRIVAEVRNTTQIADLLSSTVVIWGSPGDPAHDTSRGWACNNARETEVGPCERPDGLGEDAFLRQPVSCVTPLDFGFELEPWNVPPGSTIERASDSNGTLIGCDQIPFDPTVGASPTNPTAASPSGLDFQLEMPNAGLLTDDTVAEGQAKKVEVTLPEGMTINPSQANGLAACSPAQLARETASSPAGAGCPEASKVGTVQVSTPLLAEEVKGSLYVAAPYDNPFNSLLALYLVAKSPERGVLVKQAGKVALNPSTGQIVTTFDDLPQIPFDSFKVHFFEGSRAPLVMPPKCGTYQLQTKFTPWHASNPDSPLPSEVVVETSSFTVGQGPNGKPCPSGTPPFDPGFTAGTANNAAGSYSPFIMRLTREDGEQELTRFSVKLPRGVIGKLAGIPLCPDAAIAAAGERTGPNGGQEELDNPSCPAASQIGRTLVGAGVGPELSYAPGRIYLAGPYRGAKLSIAAIATAKVGPFDLGTVVIRQALRIDPETAEVTSDGRASKPIPHILQGIVVHARDIRVYIDRANFVLNPTSCERKTAAADVFGSGVDFGSPADDKSVAVSSPFQAADCASLGFKPRLSLKLLGGTKRSDTPRLRAVLKARKGDANIGRAQVTLPESAFLEQAHIRTICTRVQFRAGGGNGEKCPKASIYGRATAISPLLDEPLKGPVFLRSSDNELPDMVAALGSRKVDINLVGRIDSLNGRLRTTFAGVPDAPVTKFVLEMQGGNKGLIVNSTNICKGKQRAIANFKGQNGRQHLFHPVVKAKCNGKAKKGGRRK